MNAVKDKSRGEWYFAHTLAGYGFVTLAILFAFDIYMSMTSVRVIPLPLFARVVLGCGSFVAFWHWIRMLVDFFRERPARHPVLWGWVMVLGMVLGSFPYFWLVWRPRNRPA